MTTEDKFDEKGFWQKIGTSALKAGKAIIRQALAMFACLRDPKTPLWVKAIIAPALTYFISPLDAIPDFLPIGFADDAGIIAAAVAASSLYITDEHWAWADEKLETWFGKAAA